MSGRGSSASDNIEKWLSPASRSNSGTPSSPVRSNSGTLGALGRSQSPTIASPAAHQSLSDAEGPGFPGRTSGLSSPTARRATSAATSAGQPGGVKALSAAFAELRTSGPGFASGPNFPSGTRSSGGGGSGGGHGDQRLHSSTWGADPSSSRGSYSNSNSNTGISSQSAPVTPNSSLGRKWFGTEGAVSASSEGYHATGGFPASSYATQSFPSRQSGHQSPRRYGQAPETIYAPRPEGHVHARSRTVAADNEKLYEAYSELHGLAQAFRKPFDAPAILIVGHQTDGKSALVEALMGFQFNHVGGGTKTRRPITLQMTYNPECLEPKCFLVFDREMGREEQKTLPQLQAYIERENQRLEGEGGRFSDREIMLRVEYKYCPNLTIIDTPGLISAAPGSFHSVLQDQAATVEALVVAKMQQREFVILCLEDSNDWNNATTRKVVMMVDPELSRTIIVSTKLDTKIPQFSRPSDVETFLSPALPGVPASRIGNKPFFTSVPSGRVGSSMDSVFPSDESFREAVLMREQSDVVALENKLGRPLTEEERSRIGVSKLRLFLEQLLQHRYLESVPFIVPLLDGELKSINSRLGSVRNELMGMSDKQLKEKTRDFRDKFMNQVTLLLRGTVAAPPEAFGETLEDERARGGTFLAEGGPQIPARNMPNASMRLYGGAQYHRAMAEFRFMAGAVGSPAVSREEIVNSCGVEDLHDGTNYYRTACVIAVKKAWDVFEPYLRQLGHRLSHIVRRLFPIVIYLLKRDKEAMLQHELFLEHVASSFNSFVDETEASCLDKCMEDLTSTTRFVSWTLHQKNQTAFRSFMETSMPFPNPGPAPAHPEDASSNTGSPLQNPLRPPAAQAQPQHAAAEGTPGTPSGLVRLLGTHMGSSSTSSPYLGNAAEAPTGPGTSPLHGSMGAGAGVPGLEPHDALGGALGPSAVPGQAGTAASRLSDVLEGSLWTKRLAPSSEDLVNALVARIFYGVRDHFVLSAELKFNCFFLMPLLDKYPARLREDLEALASGDTETVFDIVRSRRMLEREEAELQEELSRMQALQAKFMEIYKSLTIPPVA